MSLLRTLKKMVLGETWLLPLGIAVITGACALVRSLLPDATWHDIGGFALLAGVAFVLTLSVARGARPRA